MDMKQYLRAIGLALAMASGLVVAASHASATVLPGPHQLQNRQSHECLDVTGARTYNGAEVKIWRCVNEANQRWTPTTPGTYTQLQVEHSGKCLSIQGVHSNANVVQDVCEGRGDQLWLVVPYADGYSYIMA